MDSKSIVARYRKQSAEPSENLRYFAEDVAPVLEKMLKDYSAKIVDRFRSNQKPWEPTYSRGGVKVYSDAGEASVFGGITYGGKSVLSFGAILYLDDDTMIHVNVEGTGAGTVWRGKTDDKIALKPGHGNTQSDAQSAMTLIELAVTDVLQKA